MADSNLTIRMDDALRKKVEDAAAKADQSVTEFILRAAKMRMDTACHTCGRDVGGGNYVAPGMTEVFTSWCNQRLQERSTVHKAVFVTHEPDGRRVYTGSFDKECLHDSYITLMIDVGRDQILLPIARQHIVMWEDQASGEWLRKRLVHWGYADMTALLQGQLARGGRR